MKIRFKIKNELFILLIFVIFTSCLTNVDEEMVIDPKEPDPCVSITFSMNVKPIIDNNCVSCHSAGGNFPNLNSFSGISANAANVKFQVTNGLMPQGTPLSNEDIQAIVCWVDNGALNN
jgi:uncharacterized membrane protein